MIKTNCVISRMEKLRPEQETFPGLQSLTRDSVSPVDRGLIMVSSNLSYIIEPLPDSEGHHLIYRSEHLKLPLGNCGVEYSKSTTRDWVLHYTNQTRKRPRRVSLNAGVNLGVGFSPLRILTLDPGVFLN